MMLRPNRKPLLLGMNNPLSDEPEFDLYPYPKHSSGWRLWQMLPEGTSRSQYLKAFERRNLIRSKKWMNSEARKSAEEMLPLLAGRLVVVLGSDVRAAFGFQRAEPLSLHSVDLGKGKSMAWVAFPHPSGRNHWFYNENNYAAAAAVITLLYERPIDASIVEVLQEIAG